MDIFSSPLTIGPLLPAKPTEAGEATMTVKVDQSLLVQETAKLGVANISPPAIDSTRPISATPTIFDAPQQTFEIYTYKKPEPINRVYIQNSTPNPDSRAAKDDAFKLIEQQLLNGLKKPIGAADILGLVSQLNSETNSYSNEVRAYSYHVDSPEKISAPTFQSGESALTAELRLTIKTVTGQSIEIGIQQTKNNNPNTDSTFSGLGFSMEISGDLVSGEREALDQLMNDLGRYADVFFQEGKLDFSSLSLPDQSVFSNVDFSAAYFNDDGKPEQYAQFSFSADPETGQWKLGTAFGSSTQKTEFEIYGYASAEAAALLKEFINHIDSMDYVDEKDDKDKKPSFFNTLDFSALRPDAFSSFNFSSEMLRSDGKTIIDSTQYSFNTNSTQKTLSAEKNGASYVLAVDNTFPLTNSRGLDSEAYQGVLDQIRDTTDNYGKDSLYQFFSRGFEAMMTPPPKKANDYSTEPYLQTITETNLLSDIPDFSAHFEYQHSQRANDFLKLAIAQETTVNKGRHQDSITQNRTMKSEISVYEPLPWLERVSLKDGNYVYRRETRSEEDSRTVISELGKLSGISMNSEIEEEKYKKVVQMHRIIEESRVQGETSAAVSIGDLELIQGSIETVSEKLEQRLEEKLKQNYSLNRSFNQ